MTSETIEKIRQAVETWDYYQALPPKLQGFRLDKTVRLTKDSYDIFAYISDELHKRVVIYYHDETREYKLRIKLGVIEFCDISFVAEDLNIFESQLRANLESLLANMAKFNPATLNSFVRHKKIVEWGKNNKLPENILGFELFVKPSEPVKINNGSYIVIDYVDFALESSFTIYYNIFRDEFFGEARIVNIPDVSYDFDAGELTELKEKLQQHLEPRLQFIKDSAKRELLRKKKE